MVMVKFCVMRLRVIFGLRRILIRLILIMMVNLVRMSWLFGIRFIRVRCVKRWCNVLMLSLRLLIRIMMVF